MPLLAVDQCAVDPGKAREWCARLEAGDVLYFASSPIPLAADALSFLLRQQQTESGLHKNIAYKADSGTISGLDAKATGSAAGERLRGIMRGYSESVDRFLRGFLLSYGGRWRLDYASFRPLEEQGRNLPLRRRNDLLHVDAFPTRPTHGARILRFFNNLHPERTRDWVVSDPFGAFVRHYAPRQIRLPRAAGAVRSALQTVATATDLGRIIPSLKRSPYDDFMMRFHNFLKENAPFQDSCPKYPLKFPPGSSWMVYTDMVPHAVLAGQFALEQTLLVEHKVMVSPEHSPLAVLSEMTHSALL